MRYRPAVSEPTLTRQGGGQISYYDHEIAKHHTKEIRSQVELLKRGPRQHQEREGLKNAAHNC